MGKSSTKNYARIWFLALILSSCSNLFYYPTHFLYDDPIQRGLTFENIEFNSLDGTKLFGWYFSSSKSQKKRGSILFFHGNAQNLSSHYLHLIWVTEQGYDLFIFDYRGYGLSEGQANQQGLYKDGIAALEWFRKKNKGKKLIAYGQSLGGAVLLRAMSDYSRQKEYSLLVLDSTFRSYQEVARSKVKSFVRPLTYLLISDEYATKKQDLENKIEIPTLVIHGKADKVVPFELGQNLFMGLQKAPQKWFWGEEEMEHIETFFGKFYPLRKRFLDLVDVCP